MKRLREWFAETHTDTFELVRHFLARFFDSELGATSGDWQRVAIGAFAALVSIGILFINTYWQRFALLQVPSISTPATYQAAVREDLLAFIGLGMAITALLTLIQWDSLFPSLRDCLALAGFPVSARQIFFAKFIALVILFLAFALTLNVPIAGLFSTAISGAWQENPSGVVLKFGTLAAAIGACTSVFFSLLALQGLLLNIIPSRFFLRVSLWVQAALFIATVGALPLLGRQPTAALWWPPVWFVHLWEAIVTGGADARPALLALALPPVLAVVFYLLSYHRYRRLLIEAPPSTAGGRSTAFAARVLELWIPNPREQAAFAFIWKTLARSRAHRLILLACGGIALGWVLKGALDSPPVTLRDEGMYGLVSVFVPLALSILTILALRYLFALPVALGANWLFQTADAEGRAAWLAAVQRFVIACGIVPFYLISLPATIAILGPIRALAVTALGAAVALISFERLFRHWHKLPFTCSYLPGKQPAWMLMLRCAFGMIYLAAVPQLLLSASADPAAFLALFTFLIALAWRWRTVRRREWDEASLVYVEAQEADLFSLGLRPLEEDAQVTNAAARAPAMFSSGMVASRGFIPEAWEEELDEDRRHPAAILHTFLEDARYSLRLVRRSPLLSLTVVLTLTVGIGINASIFAVVNGMMLRPHVSGDPSTFLRIVPESRFQNQPRQISSQEYAHLRDHTKSVRQLAAVSYFPAMIGDDDPGGNPGAAVSCNFFLVEGLSRPILGRPIDASDCGAPGQAPVAVINVKTWRTRFASDPHIINRVVRVNNRPVTIVGVVSDLTTGWLNPPSLWIPYTAQPYMDSSRNAFVDESVLWLMLAGRLAPGVSRSQAQAEFNILEHQEDILHPGRNTAVVTTDGTWIEEFELNMSGRDLMLMTFFLGSFFLVLVIACANVATLLLSRAATRRKEIAVRLSLGAPRIRLVRMLITESLLLASFAGAASLYLVQRIPRPLFRYLAPRAPEFPMDPDWLIFAFLAAVVLLSGIAAGLAPALESLNVDLSGSIKGQAGSPAGNRVRGWLVTAQVALSMILLVGAGLFGKAEDRTLHADPGYLPGQVVVAPIRFPESTPLATAKARLDAIALRVRALPGVHSIAFSDALPMIDRTTVELRPPGRADAVQPVDMYTGSPAFFETLGLPIVRGREFQETDRDAVVVSHSLARTFWPREDPLGKTVIIAGISSTVVGVAKDVEGSRFAASENLPLYHVRHPHPSHNILCVRFNSDPRAGVSALRAALREYDPTMFVTARVLQSWIDQMTEVLWNVVSLILLLGVVATVLATSGIYGAVSFAVNQRTREMGIRLALGAQRLHIVREIFLSGGGPVLRGLFLGLWGSVAVAATLHHGMSGTPLHLDSSDPILYGGSAVLLAAAAGFAMAAPARRASHCDPLDALRCD